MKLKDPRFRYVAAATVLILAGLSAFIVGRYAFSEDAPVEAQINPEPSAGTPVYTLDPKGTPFPPGTPVYVVGPDGTPVVHIPSAPHPDLAARSTAIAEDNEKPRFIGELNGFRFIDLNDQAPQDEGDCTRDELEFFVSDEARTVVHNSELDFEVTYVPSGSDQAAERATTCRGEVRLSERVYESNKDENVHVLEIGRINSAPVVHSFAPEDRLEPRTINGRPSVLIEPVFGDHDAIIYMRDDEGTLWLINGSGIGTDEMIRIAEGIE